MKQPEYIMKGLPPISTKDFVDKFDRKEDIRTEVWETLVHLQDVVHKYNNPYPFNPQHKGCTSFYFFYTHVINPGDDITPFKSLPDGNLLSITWNE